MEENGALAMMVVYPDYVLKVEQVKGYFSHKGMSLIQDKKNVKTNMPVFHISQKWLSKCLDPNSTKK